MGNALTSIPPEFAEIATICTATEIEIGGRTVFGIADARDLHAGLKVGRDYTNWIKGRIAKYGFREGADFAMTQDLRSPNPASTKSRAQVAHTYRLTLDMAKELAMVENNDQGRMVRRYFIWADEQLRAAAAKPVKVRAHRRALPSPASAPASTPDAYGAPFGVEIAREMYRAIMSANVRVERGQAPDFGTAMEAVFSDIVTQLYGGDPVMGKILLGAPMHRARAKWAVPLSS